MTEQAYELVMPFVTTASHGGPHDDDSFVAGWSMCLLDVRLAAGPDLMVETVRSDCREQADLIAMKHGYRAEFADTDVDGWHHARFMRADVEA